jgi:hypothetical protein
MTRNTQRTPSHPVVLPYPTASAYGTPVNTTSNTARLSSASRQSKRRRGDVETEAGSIQYDRTEGDGANDRDADGESRAEWVPNSLIEESFHYMDVRKLPKSVNIGGLIMISLQIVMLGCLIAILIRQ